jgi:multimeric flavodoxin WrbA
MNVVALLGSPRTNGNSAAIARRFTEAAAGRGARVRTYELNRLTYRGCQGCYACKKTLDHCILDDDLTEVLAAVREADLVVLATPVYYGEVTGQLKCFIDRTFSYLVPDYAVNPQPSRLPPGKKLVFVIAQGHPDEALFADIFPRYSGFLNWMGFADTRLIRDCGIGPARVDAPSEKALREAGELAAQLVNPGSKP